MQIRVNSVSKKYAKNAKSWARYKFVDFVSKALALKNECVLRKHEYWAVKDVSFDLEKGDILGVIGRNGCGKTTLLRMIANILEPDKGTVALRGKPDYLSSAGYSYYPKLTGLENIWILGTMMGMSASELRQKIDSIAKYSELEEYLHMPVSCYSSGMRSRLGFSVSIHMSTQILIIDETLSAGDEKFRKKCIESIRQLTNQKVCIIASHSLGQIKQMANKVLFLEKGRVAYFGDPQTAIDRYTESLGSTDRHRNINKKCISKIELRVNNLKTKQPPLIDMDHENLLEVHFKAHPPTIPLKTRIVFINIIRKSRYVSWGSEIPIIAEGDCSMSCVIPTSILESGRYRIRIDFFLCDEKKIYLTHQTKSLFVIPGKNSSPQRELIDLSWKFTA